MKSHLCPILNSHLWWFRARMKFDSSKAVTQLLRVAQWPANSLVTQPLRPNFIKGQNQSCQVTSPSEKNGQWDTAVLVEQFICQIKQQSFKIWRLMEHCWSSSSFDIKIGESMWLPIKLILLLLFPLEGLWRRRLVTFLLAACRRLVHLHKLNIIWENQGNT